MGKLTCILEKCDTEVKNRIFIYFSEFGLLQIYCANLNNTNIRAFLFFEVKNY